MPLPPVLVRIESSHRLNAPIVLTAISPTGSDAHGRPTPQWTPGQQFRARVLETDNAGRARVEVGGRQFMMTLPAWIHDGDSVELTYLHAQPRIAFALPRPPAPSGDAQVSLGAAARMIGALVQTDHTQAHDPQAPGSAGQRPAAAPLFVGTVPQAGAAPLTEPSTLIGAAPLAGALLAPLLRKALSQSGLFYESHQLQWLSGQRSLESLLAEPAGSTVDGTKRHAGNASRHGDGCCASRHVGRRGAARHVDRFRASRPGAPRAPHPDTLPLVRQQLDSFLQRPGSPGKGWSGPASRSTGRSTNHLSVMRMPGIRNTGAHGAPDCTCNCRAWVRSMPNFLSPTVPSASSFRRPTPIVRPACGPHCLTSNRQWTPLDCPWRARRSVMREPPAGANGASMPLAVALAYQDGAAAPQVVAKGRGAIAAGH